MNKYIQKLCVVSSLLISLFTQALIFEESPNPYIVKDGKVYYEKTLIPDADAQTFKWSGNDFGKDQFRVYFKNDILKGADPHSFEFLFSLYQYAKDKNNVYYVDFQPKKSTEQVGALPKADPATFKLLKDGYSKDKQNVYFKATLLPKLKSTNISVKEGYVWNENVVYYFGERLPKLKGKNLLIQGMYAWDGKTVYFKGKELAEVDAVSFMLLEPDSLIHRDPIPSKELVYAKDKNHIYYDGKPIGNVDVNSFQLLSHLYAKDQNHIYKRGRVYAQNVENLDVESFALVPENSSRTSAKPSSGRSYSSWYSPFPYVKDKNQVYYDTGMRLSRIEQADPHTFYALTGSRYAYDKNWVYFGEETIPNSDGDSFKQLNAGYAQDKNQVYYYGKVIANADPQRFQLIDQNRGFAKDQKHLYLKTETIKGIDAASFEMVDDMYYTKDKNHVYYDFQHFKPIKGADPKTFTYSRKTEPYGIDKRHFFYQDKMVKGSDARTLVILRDKRRYPSGYAKDKQHVYYYGQTVEGADLNSFEVIDSHSAKDKNHSYRKEKAIIK